MAMLDQHNQELGKFRYSNDFQKSKYYKKNLKFNQNKNWYQGNDGATEILPNRASRHNSVSMNTSLESGKGLLNQSPGVINL